MEIDEKKYIQVRHILFDVECLKNKVELSVEEGSSVKTSYYVGGLINELQSLLRTWVEIEDNRCHNQILADK